MKIYVNKLTDFSIGHGEEAEFAIQNALARLYNLTRGPMTFGYQSDYDFILNNTKIELKIASKAQGTLELSRANGTLSGLSATTSDVYLFLNPSGNVGKLRAIATPELKKVYKNIPSSKCFVTSTVGDKIGSCLTSFSFRAHNDLMLAECDCYTENGSIVFDTDTIRGNTYARDFVRTFIK